MATMKSWRSSVSLALVTGALSSGCIDDELEIPESFFGEPVCMMAVSAGHYDEDNLRIIIDRGSRLHPAGCACVPPEERHDWSEETLDRLSEAALAECERAANTYYDFAWDDCIADFEAKTWYPFTYYVGPDGNASSYHPPDLRCIDP